jgi:hypothetical protein
MKITLQNGNWYDDSTGIGHLDDKEVRNIVILDSSIILQRLYDNCDLYKNGKQLIGYALDIMDKIGQGNYWQFINFILQP